MSAPLPACRFDTNFGGALGGAVDIVAVRQRDGSVRTTPFYVRFGKFQGVLKSKERVVRIDVNGESCGVEMAISNSGEAYFVEDEPPSAAAVAVSLSDAEIAVTVQDAGLGVEDAGLGVLPAGGGSNEAHDLAHDLAADGTPMPRLPTIYSQQALSDANGTQGIYTTPKPSHGGVAVPGGAGARRRLDELHEGGGDAELLSASAGSVGPLMTPSWHRPGVALDARTPERTTSLSEHVLAHVMEADEAAAARAERAAKRREAQRRDAHAVAHALLGEAPPLPASLCAAALRQGAPRDRAFEAARLNPEVVASLGRRARDSLVFRLPSGRLMAWPDVQEAALRALVGASDEQGGLGVQDGAAAQSGIDSSGMSDVSDGESMGGSWYMGRAGSLEPPDFGARGRSDSESSVGPSRLGRSFSNGEVLDIAAEREVAVGGEPGGESGGGGLAAREGAEGAEGADADVEDLTSPRAGDDTTQSPSRSWLMWPFSRSQSASMAEEDSGKTTSPAALRREARRSRYRRRHERHYRPLSAQMAVLAAKLRDGHNLLKFTFESSVWGTQVVESNLYLWSWDSKVVVTDVDGTITKSDVLGQVLPAIGRDWSQPDVATLLNGIVENGYRLIYLSARALVQASRTREFLSTVRQGELQLPDGPVLLSPDGLMPALYREVIQKRPQDFKIACLGDVRSLFPSEWHPFYAGFGNRPTDVLAYRAVGVPTARCFTIDPNGAVTVYTGGASSNGEAGTSKAAVKATARSQARLPALGTYAGIVDLRDQVFPPLAERPCAGSNCSPEREQKRAAADVPTDDRFSAFAYWRTSSPVANVSNLTEDDLEALG